MLLARSMREILAPILVDKIVERKHTIENLKAREFPG